MTVFLSRVPRLTDREALLETLERVRKRGATFDDKERVKGLRCVAVPILCDGHPEGSISVLTP